MVLTLSCQMPPIYFYAMCLLCQAGKIVTSAPSVMGVCDPICSARIWVLGHYCGTRLDSQFKTKKMPVEFGHGCTTVGSGQFCTDYGLESKEYHWCIRQNAEEEQPINFTACWHWATQWFFFSGGKESSLKGPRGAEPRWSRGKIRSAVAHIFRLRKTPFF